MENNIKRGIGVTIIVLAINALVCYEATRNLVQDEQWVRHTYQVITQLEVIFSAIKDAETGERGFIITGSDEYLQPFQDAVAQIDEHIQKLKDLTVDNPLQHSRIPVLQNKINALLTSLRAGIDLRKSGNIHAANQFIVSGTGKQMMDDLGAFIEQMRNDEDSLLQQRTAEARASQRRTIGTFVVANLIACAVLLITATLTLNGIRTRKREQDEQRAARLKTEAERTRLLAQAETARESAEAASRAKDEFLAVLSHELRTPLTSVYGWVQLLQGCGLDDVTRAKALEVIDRNVRAQTRLIDDLLNISQIITGKLQIRREMTDPLRAVKAAIETARPSADAKEIHIRLETDEALSPIFVDPARLQQVVWNLLSNAVKFTAKGGDVLLRVHQTPSELQISVRDTGQGISPEFLPQVFNRFSQADASSTRSHGGLGLGLALVKQLVELHGGTVRAESAGVGKGSTFTITFPIPAAARPQPASLSSGDDSATLKGVHVMVVEDESDTRDMIAEVLQQFGASVTQTASASDALRLFVSGKPPNVLISDIGMPDMDGYQLLAALHEKSRSVPPAIALTAFASAADKERSRDAGFQAHLSKPIELSQLVLTVADLARRRAS